MSSAQKGLFGLHILNHSLLREVKAKTQIGQEPRGRSWCRGQGAAYWLTTHGCFHIQDHKHGNDITHNGLDLLQSITN